MAARDTGELRQLKDSRKTIEEATQVIVMVKDDAENASEVEALKKNQELLVKCISQNLGYVEGKPVAACLIYKCLIHWRSFEIEETKIFDLIVQAIASAIEGCMRGALVSSLDRQERKVVPKHRAVLFMQQLIGFLEKIYGMIRDNLKREISPLLVLCIQEARTKRNAVPQQPLTDHWQIIVERLSSYLNLMKANNYAGSAWDELRHIRQSVGFLFIHQKPKKTLDEITREVCPVLSIRQLYRISLMYWDDKYGTHSVSSDVVANMKVMMTEDSNNAVSRSFLLDDDSR
ncbi:unnamed protein product [Arabis nemorensis]|uniref:Dilute domain-containing protein n=1 Tax=Arabis nemorensis TaxID=586526 RepID=A0A565CTT6_9BRAS|nr:unnamed protein product [Arabis nemorensis]